MARKLRIEYSGAIYHVSCRMVGSWREGDRDLFRDDGDRWRFLERLGERVETYSIVLHQYVLMQNHAHLVIETPQGNCSAFMQSLLTAYTVYYNRRHQRHGHLFDGRYKAKLVQGDDYLLALSRYVHLNPLRVGKWRKADTVDRRKALRSYYWSSYLQYIGRRKKNEWVTYAPTLALLRCRKREQPAGYRKFVENGLMAPDEEFAADLKESPLSIGDEDFRKWAHGLYLSMIEKSNKPEDVSFRKQIALLSAEKVLAVVGTVLQCKREDFGVRKHRSAARPFAAWFLRRYAGMGQRAIAELLNVGTGAAISLQIKKYGKLLVANRQLRKKANRCEKHLSALRLDAQNK